MGNLVLALLLLCGQDYEWKPIPNAPNEIGLWSGGKQIGSLCKENLRYFALEAGSFVEAPVPAPIPEELLKSRFEQLAAKGGNFGVDLDKIGNQERFDFCGEEISKSQAMQLIGASDGFPDDSAKLRLTIIGSTSERSKARKSLESKEEFKDFSKDLHIQTYDPNSWAIKGRGFKTLGPLTYYLQEPNGKVLYQGDSEEGLLDRLRSLRRPPPSPWTLDWSSWGIGINPFTWFVGFNWSKLQIPLEPVVLIVVVVAGFFYLRSKK